MKLNTFKITKELKRLDRNLTWLAKETNTSKQLVAYWMKAKSLYGAERIGKALGIEPKDLIK